MVAVEALHFAPDKFHSHPSLEHQLKVEGQRVWMCTGAVDNRHAESLLQLTRGEISRELTTNNVHAALEPTHHIEERISAVSGCLLLRRDFPTPAHGLPRFIWVALEAFHGVRGRHGGSVRACVSDLVLPPVHLPETASCLEGPISKRESLSPPLLLCCTLDRGGIGSSFTCLLFPAFTTPS